MTVLPPEQQKLFEEPNLAAVSTLGVEGEPHVTMVWVDIEGDELVFNSAEHRGWPKNLRRDPRIGICVLDGNSWVRNVRRGARDVDEYRRRLGSHPEAGSQVR